MHAQRGVSLSFEAFLFFPVQLSLFCLVLFFVCLFCLSGSLSDLIVLFCFKTSWADAILFGFLISLWPVSPENPRQSPHGRSLGSKHHSVHRDRGSSPST